MVAPKRQCMPSSVVLLMSNAADERTFSILVRSHLFLNIILLDSGISHPTPCSLTPSGEGPHFLVSCAWQSCLLEHGPG